MLSLSRRRKALGLLIGSTIIGSGIFVQLDRSQQLRVTSGLQGVKRAGRAAVVWTRLVLDYKLLYRSKPDLEGPDEEENARKLAEFKEKRKRIHERNAARILRLCESNGGLFVKMGQHAASLRPAVPEEYISVLSKLQDQAPIKSVEDVDLVLRNELDDVNYEEISNGLCPEPVGSASLAQVHKCILKNGKTVAVKIQHIGLEWVVKSDINIVKLADFVASKIFSDEGYSLAWAVREFEKNLRQELGTFVQPIRIFDRSC